jgi:hypothetical protein
MSEKEIVLVKPFHSLYLQDLMFILTWHDIFSRNDVFFPSAFNGSNTVVIRIGDYIVSFFFLRVSDGSNVFLLEDPAFFTLSCSPSHLIT